MFALSPDPNREGGKGSFKKQTWPKSRRTLWMPLAANPLVFPALIALEVGKFDISKNHSR